MAVGKRRRARQLDLFVPVGALAEKPASPFYDRLNRLLEAIGFDALCESAFAPYYDPDTSKGGRPALAPGNFMRLLIVGFFEGLDSDRGIAWRAADSMTIRNFIGCSITEHTPDHSTLSGIRRRVGREVYDAIFQQVLAEVARRGLLSGEAIGVDGSMIRANASMKGIVRRDSGETYSQYVDRLATDDLQPEPPNPGSGASALDAAPATSSETPAAPAGPASEPVSERPTGELAAPLDAADAAPVLSRGERKRFDRKRARKKRKTTSNKDWRSPVDKDARIARLADGRTRLAYKLNHAVDLGSGAIVAVHLSPADCGDATAFVAAASAAAETLAGVMDEVETYAPRVRTVVTDKGGYSTDALEQIESMGWQPCLAESMSNRPKPCTAKVRQRNHRTVRTKRGRGFMRKRAELVERSFAHTLETGGGRRSYLRGMEQNEKRVLTLAIGFNLSVVMRKLTGSGKPRSASWQALLACKAA